MNKIEFAKKQIEFAKQHREDDPHLANYVLRDLEVVKDADLTSLTWAMHQDGYVTKYDVDYLIELIEKEIAKQEGVG